MNPLIQKKLDEFDEKFPRSGYLYAGFVEATAEMHTFLTTALQEALIAGLEMSIKAVPDGLQGTDLFKIGSEFATPRDYRREARNDMRAETLAAIKALKKEVMEGKV